MPRAGEAPAPSRVCHELERGLAVAVLEILLSQPVAMNSQQKLAPGASHQCDLLRRVERPQWPTA